MSVNATIADPPKTFREKLKWLGPGILWMVSAAGSGELLFTPRIGSLYGYSLLWAMLAAVALKWFINREIGRYTVCTGKTVIDGFSLLKGPKNWALYFILVPQLFVAGVTIAGLAGSASTALVLVLPGNVKLWTIISICCSTVLVLWGKFKVIEIVATVLAILLGVSAIVAAASVMPHMDAFAAGLIPKMPENVKYEEVLPWLGFMMSGAAGMIWYSYWIKEEGYGLSGGKQTTNHSLSGQEKKKLQKWVNQMTLDNSVAVAGTLLVTLAFLILGTELLKPRGLIPEENKVAEVLGQLLGQLWGPVGFWFMITAVFIGFWDTVLSDQDGFGRMFSGGTRILFRRHEKKYTWLNETFLKKAFIIVLVTLIPIAIYLLLGEPLALLKIAGAIEAAHIPVVAGLVLYLNRSTLEKELQPSLASFILTALAGLFFAVFAVIYFLQLSEG
jgi:Mn2+/Fe2+ NRAMP family transporter